MDLTPDEKHRIYLEERERLAAHELAQKKMAGKRTEHAILGCLGFLGSLGLLFVVVALIGTSTRTEGVSSKPTAHARKTATKLAKVPHKSVSAARGNRKRAPRRRGRLGIRRDQVVRLFSAKHIDFTFEESPLANGTPRAIGRPPNGLAMLELTGKPEDLKSLSLLITAPNDAPGAAVLNAIYAAAFLQQYAPRSKDWVWARVGAAAKSKRDVDVKRVFDGRRVGVITIVSLGMVVITVEPTS